MTPKNKKLLFWGLGAGFAYLIYYEMKQAQAASAALGTSAGAGSLPAPTSSPYQPAKMPAKGSATPTAKSAASQPVPTTGPASAVPLQDVSSTVARDPADGTFFGQQTDTVDGTPLPSGG